MNSEGMTIARLYTDAAHLQRHCERRRAGCVGAMAFWEDAKRGWLARGALLWAGEHPPSCTDRVEPAITETATRRVILEKPGYREWAATQMLPVGLFNQPDDLVGAVLFLSSHLSDMVVAHVLMGDGGWLIH